MPVRGLTGLYVLTRLILQEGPPATLIHATQEDTEVERAGNTSAPPGLEESRIPSLVLPQLL